MGVIRVLRSCKLSDFIVSNSSTLIEGPFMVPCVGGVDGPSSGIQIAENGYMSVSTLNNLL